MAITLPFKVTFADWNPKPGCPNTSRRTYFASPMGSRAVTAEVTADPTEGRVWFIAFHYTGAHDRWNNPVYEVIARGSYAYTPGAMAVAKRRATRLARPVAHAAATSYYEDAIANVTERADRLRAALADLELTEHRKLAELQDELAAAEGRVDELRAGLLTLAA